MNRTEPLNVAVLGTGIIGMDLIIKIRRSPALECGLVAGRNERSAGLRHAAELGCMTTAGGSTLCSAPRARSTSSSTPRTRWRTPDTGKGSSH